MPLRWGIDSLYLSYPGELSASADAQLSKLKQQAQGQDYEAARAQFVLGDHIFEVKDKGSGLFKFGLVDGHYDIKLSTSKARNVPMAYVQVRSGVLTAKSPADIEAEVRALLAEIGNVTAPKVSRVDLFVDFASLLDMEGWPRQAWVTRASAVHQYAEDSAFTGWMIGAGGPLVARLYLKILECQKTGKAYLMDLWRQAGWDEVMPVWRLELEFRRECLAQLDVGSLPAVLGNLNGLWSYALTEWLRLCDPNPNDKTRARWPIHPLWAALASVDWETDGGPLARTFPKSRAPSVDWIGRRALGLVASIASLKHLSDFAEASFDLMHAASNALGERYSLSGISLDQGFAEMVEVCNRKYNIAVNDPDPEEDPEQPRLQNPYWRGKQGL